jgi:hypothetical protein
VLTICNINDDFTLFFINYNALLFLLSACSPASFWTVGSEMHKADVKPDLFVCQSGVCMCMCADDVMGLFLHCVGMT